MAIHRGGSAPIWQGAGRIRAMTDKMQRAYEAMTRLSLVELEGVVRALRDRRMIMPDYSGFRWSSYNGLGELTDSWLRVEPGTRHPEEMMN